MTEIRLFTKFVETIYSIIVMNSESLLNLKTELYNKIKERLEELNIYYYILYTSVFLDEYDFEEDDEEAGKYLPEEYGDDFSDYKFYTSEYPGGYSGTDVYVYSVCNDEKGLCFDVRELYSDTKGVSMELNAFYSLTIDEIEWRYGEEYAVYMLELVLNGTKRENIIELNRLADKRAAEEEEEDEE